MYKLKKNRKFEFLKMFFYGNYFVIKIKQIAGYMLNFF